jgi:hypothetical protein
LLLSVAAKASNATTTSPSEIANANLFFQWQKDGVDIAGAIQRTLNLTLVPAVRGFYSVRVTLSGEVVKSNAVLVSHATWPAIITKQPTDVYYHRGENAKLSIEVFGTLSGPVIWFDVNKFFSTGWQIGSTVAYFPAATLQSAVVGTGLNLLLDNEATKFGQFFAVIAHTNYLINQLSGWPFPTENFPRNISSLLNHPKYYNRDINGETVTDAISNTVTASRQWLENVQTGKLFPLSLWGSSTVNTVIEVDVGADLALRIYEPDSEFYSWNHGIANPDGSMSINSWRDSISQSSTLNFGSFSAEDFGYYLIVGVGGGYAPFKLAPVLRPTITQQPVSSTAPVYSKIAFSVIAGPAGEAVTYQWKKGDSLIVGATSAEYRFTLTEATAGSYSVEVSLGGYTVASNKAEARILQPPMIITQPQGASVLLGASISLGVAVAEYNFAQPITALWKRDGVSLSANGTNFNFYVNGVTEADLGAYTVELTNAAGTTVSAPAMIKFAAPQIAVQPVAVQVTGVGVAVNLSCAATLNSGTVTYQWQRNEVNVAGATQATLSFLSVQVSDFGRYRCLVTSSGGTTTSDAVLLSVGAALAPSVILPSALGLKRGELCNIPLFSNSEIKTWSTTALPDGLILEPANGRIIGTPTTAGIYVVSISAANAFGNNTQVLLLDVAETSGTRKAGFNAWIDVETRAVSVNGKPDGVVTCKPGDDVLLFVRFVKGGVPVDLDVQSLQVMFEDAPELISDFVKKVDAVGDFYVVRVSIPAFQGDFPMREQAQFAWTATNAWSVGPSIILGSSNSFPVVIEEHWGMLP